MAELMDPLPKPARRASPLFHFVTGCLHLTAWEKPKWANIDRLDCARNSKDVWHWVPFTIENESLRL